MKAKWLLSSFVVCMIFSTSGYAKELENVTVVKNFDNVVIQDSSAYNRIGQDYLITYETGMAVAPVPSAGLTFGKYLSRNSVVQGNISSGILPFFYSTLQTQTTTVSYKGFAGNSFYYRAGAGFREIKLLDWQKKGEFYDVTGGPELGRSRSFVADLAIGNQWQWKYFTLGVDWIGFMPSLATVESRTDTSWITNSEDRRRVESDWSEISKVTTTQLLRFNIGASF
jgi:hypothetical protein